MKNTKLFMFAACALLLTACGKQTVKIMTPPDASNRVLFGAEQLQTTLGKAGYQVMMQQGDTTFSDPEIKTILLTEVNDTTLKKEGFHITTAGNLTKVSGRDSSGVIYGCRELIDRVNDSEGKLVMDAALPIYKNLETPDTYIGIYQPRDGRDRLLYTLPESGISVLNVIPPVRNKVNSTDLCGPSSQAKWVNGPQTGRIVFRFME